jgi:hypothetical protein
MRDVVGLGVGLGVAVLAILGHDGESAPEGLLLCGRLTAPGDSGGTTSRLRRRVWEGENGASAAVIVGCSCGEAGSRAWGRGGFAKDGGVMLSN